MATTFAEARPVDSDWLGWLKHELAPTPLREIRTAIFVVAVVLCVIISMALQVPELAISAYMVFFFSQKTKKLTTIVGILGIVGTTISIGLSLWLYKFTFGHPELRIPAMAIAVFVGMWLSRVFVIGVLGFVIGFLVSYSQSIADQIPSAELLVRAALWIWVALVYSVVLTVTLNRLFLPDDAAPRVSSPEGIWAEKKTEASAAEARPKPKSEPDRRHLFKRDAFTNPAHVQFALKTTFAAMFCYIFYSGIDWSGIHTAFITCIFIALESTEATLYKGMLRLVGCVIGGLFAIFSIIFLIPHMETIASLVALVAAVSAIAAWVATGSERISYVGFQIAFAFFLSMFQGYAPDTDLDKIRDRVVGILIGLIVTTVIFYYVWPERARPTPVNPLDSSQYPKERHLVVRADDTRRAQR